MARTENRGGGVLGPAYRKLWTAATISTLGDGVREAALPLLAASLTRSPGLIAFVAFAGRLPWLIFSLISGALVDRLDRRRVMWTVDLFRAGVMAALAALVLAGVARIPLLALVAFLLGTGETLFDNAAQAILPGIVRADLLETANSRLYAGEVVSNQFVGPPLGSFLFVALAALPFFLDATSFAAAALLVMSIGGVFRAERPSGGQRTGIRQDIGEGVRWLWRHRLLRTLAIMLGTLNLVEGAFFAILVLFTLEILHVRETGYGLLLSAAAAGALVGSLVTTKVASRLGRGTVLLTSVAMVGASALVMGATSDPFVAAAMLAVSSGFGVAWNVVTVSLRQTIVPAPMLGRVNSVYRFLGWGSMPIGAALGGFVAERFGLRAPFYLAGVVELLMFVAALPFVNDRTVEAARAAAGSGARDDPQSMPPPADPAQPPG